MQEETAEEFVAFAVGRLQASANRVDDCLSRLTEEQVWWRAGDGQNSVANLVLHLCGNVRQWVIGAIAGASDIRDRAAGFSVREVVNISTLRQNLQQTVTTATQILGEIDNGRLAERVKVQICDRSIMEAIFTVVTHFAEHTGQIVFATKLLIQRDLGYSAKLNAVGNMPKS